MQADVSSLAWAGHEVPVSALEPAADYAVIRNRELKCK